MRYLGKMSSKTPAVLGWRETVCIVQIVEGLVRTLASSPLRDQHTLLIKSHGNPPRNSPPAVTVIPWTNSLK